MYSPSLWKDRISQNPGQFSATGSVPGNVTLTLYDNPTQAGTPVTAARMNNMEEGIYLSTQLYSDAIQGTTQTPSFTNGQITQIFHKAGSTTVRTDTFSYTSGQITETRTLNTSETVTLTYYFNADGSLNRTVVV